jgi:hypothetical protein
MSNPCPKCRRENPAGAETCAGCALIFANYDPHAVAQLRADRAARRAEAARSRNGLLLVGTLLLAGLAGGAWWSSRPDPYAFAAPPDVAGTVFDGKALDYHGPGAELRLVDVDGGEQVVGRLAADGSFRFRLPADVAPLPLPSWLASATPGDPAQWNERQRRFDEYRRTPMFRHSLALRGLGAGDAWRTLTMAPDDLVAARFGVIYVGSGSERGDLIATNSDLRGIAGPGDQMLVLIHANRAGRVEGIAERLNGFGAEVGNPWTLDLHAGWNLVLSRQLGDYMTLEYVSGELPDDLQWRALDPRTLR